MLFYSEYNQKEWMFFVSPGSGMRKVEGRVPSDKMSSRLLDVTAVSLNADTS